MSEPEIPEGIHQVINRLGELNNVVFVLGEAARLEDMLEKIILAAMPNLTKSMKGMHFKGTGSFASFRGCTSSARCATSLPIPKVTRPSTRTPCVV